jgi:threonine synthase
VLPLGRLGDDIGLSSLYVKDDGALPTGSFKARGAAIGISRAYELGIRAFAMPTNGNAGAAWAAYGARAAMRAHIVMPSGAPAVTRRECEAYGAHVTVIDGLIGDAGRVVATLVAQQDLYDASTLKEPYRIEGKKTMGFELAEQFEWNVPDVILYPTGGGVGLIGMHKALGELRALGLIHDRMPRFVAVQAEGCAPIVDAWLKHRDASEPWPHANTLAFGINVPKALGDFLILSALYETSGTAIAVADAEMLEMQHRLAQREGLFISLEGAATLAAAERLARSGWMAKSERVLAINTAMGMKDASAQSAGTVVTPHGTMHRER